MAYKNPEPRNFRKLHLALGITLIMIVMLSGCANNSSGNNSSSNNTQNKTEVNTTLQNNNTPGTVVNATPSKADSNTIIISDSKFNPPVLEINSSAKVTWINEDSIYHKIVGDRSEFESLVLASGENYTFELKSPGIYKYHCSIHSSMAGEIRFIGENNTLVVNTTNNTTANITANTTVNLSSTNQTNITNVANTTVNETKNTSSIVNTTSASTEKPIEIKAMSFNPAILRIAAGETVVWINSDKVTHKIKGYKFESPDLLPGENYKYTFESAGSYSYHCAKYAQMSGGQIIVE